MKCTICGGRALPGAKLCPPCRAALRRARDETITEFLPLPRRLEAMAISGISTLSRPIDLIKEQRARRRARKAGSVPSIDVRLKQQKYPPLYAAAITLFVLAIGVLAYGFARQLRGEPSPQAPVEAPHASMAPHAAVSPAALAEEARSNVLAPAPSTDVVPASIADEAPHAPPVPAPSPPKLRKTLAVVSRPTAKVDAPATTPVEVVPMVVAAAPPSPAPKVAPDRWQSLAAALARCGGNLFARIGCEHDARAQYCDGYWGKVAQCPGGVSNDHGQ